MKKEAKSPCLSVVVLMASLCLGFSSCGEELDSKRDYNEPVTIIDNEGIPAGSPGDQSMVGYYSLHGINGEFWQAQVSEAASSFNSSMANLSQEFAGFRIEDEKTIYHVSDYFYASKNPSRDNAEWINLESYNFTVSVPYNAGGYISTRKEYYYMYHQIGTWPWTDERHWEGRYAMNGQTMTVNTDLGQTLTMTYTNGQLEYDGVVYKKVK